MNKLLVKGLNVEGYFYPILIVNGQILGLLTVDGYLGKI